MYDEPSYIPQRNESVIKITDQFCQKCGTVHIDRNQKVEIIKNKELHDKLLNIIKINN